MLDMNRTLSQIFVIIAIGVCLTLNHSSVSGQEPIPERPIIMCVPLLSVDNPTFLMGERHPWIARPPEVVSKVLDMASRHPSVIVKVVYDPSRMPVRSVSRIVMELSRDLHRKNKNLATGVSFHIIRSDEPLR